MKIEYDPLGRRITKTVGETVYHYTWSGDQLIEIRDGDGNLLKFIIYGNNLDEPIVMMGGASTDYFTTDGLGSISEITNEYGGLEEYYTYDAYGAPSLFDGTGTPISTSAVNNPFYFTGREYDFETGIYYYRARYYDPSLGRFLETDPLGYIDSPNLYAYVGNNPWNWLDPWGLLEVYYWESTEGGGSKGGWYGHVSARLDDGTYISYWPSKPVDGLFDSQPSRKPSYELDKAGEGNREPERIKIDGLNEQAIKEWWEGEDHGNFSAFNNCSGIISEVLRQGGADIPWHMIYYPGQVREDIENYLKETQKK